MGFFSVSEGKKAQNVECFCARSSGRSGCAACGASCYQGAATQDTALFKIKTHPYLNCIILSSYKQNCWKWGGGGSEFTLLKG